MVDNCYAGIWSCDKFLAKSSKLTESTLTSDPQCERVFFCLQQEALDWKDQNQIIFAQNDLTDFSVCQILVKENSEFENKKKMLNMAYLVPTPLT